MLDTLNYQTPSTIVKQPSVPVINGQGRRSLKYLTKSQRAAFAVAVLRGEAGLQPTLHVVSRALDVSITYIETASKLTPAELRQVRHGNATLGDLKPTATPEPRKPAVTPDDIATWWWSASEADRAAVVGKVGVAPVWDALATHLA
jgi:hypothetical protein